MVFLEIAKGLFMRKTWLIVPTLIALVLARTLAGGGSDSSTCRAEIRDARAAVRGISGLPPLAFVRRALESYNHSDGVCLSSYDVYDQAITARAANWLTLTGANGEILKSREIYVCTNGLKAQRCDGLYADDALCGCEKWPDVQLTASGLTRVRTHPDFRARWFAARFEGGNFKDDVPLQVTNGLLHTKNEKLRNPHVIFALLEPKIAGIAPLKLVWRIR